jgi:hypothetical protein
MALAVVTRKGWGSVTAMAPSAVTSRGNSFGRIILADARTVYGRQICEGVITVQDGSRLLVSIHGQSVQEDASAYRRAILARLELTTEVESYRWLNTCFLVGEGEIDEEREIAWLDAFVCVNEQAQGPPAIGAEPPERFRQRGSPR